jgi:hypothetical protein
VVAAPFGASLCRGLRLVNAQLFVAGARFSGRPAALRQFDDPQDSDLAPQGQSDDASDANLLAGLEHASAIDADMTLGDDPLRERAAFDEADAVEIAVNAQG